MKSYEIMKNTVLYQMFLRSFTPSGTLAAAIRLLPMIAELGVTCIYLCPIFTADEDCNPLHWSERQRKSLINNPKNPYRIRDFFHVDAEYGSDADLKQFIDAAHALGLRVILDLVYFHCGPNAVFLKEHPDYVVHLENGEIDYGEWHFPKLNYNNPELREYMYRNMTHFISDYGADGYRCDVGYMVPLDFWDEGVRRVRKINPEAIMLIESEENEYLAGETFDADYGWKMGANLFRDFMSGKITGTEYRKNFNNLNEECGWDKQHLLFLENHDTVNDAYYDRLETVFGTMRMDAAFAYMMTSAFVPLLYNGEEIGDTARHSIFSNRFTKPELCIDWSNAATKQGKARYAYLQELIALRKSNAALRYGKMQWIENTEKDRLLTFVRSIGDETIFVAVNVTDTDLSATVLLQYEKILLSKNADCRTQGNKTKLIMPAGSAWIAKGV